jgi:uncharacterized protein (TIGR03118 family)
VADTTDPNLVNAWGLAATATSPWWVANAETDVSTIYNAAGVASSLVVTVEGGPTGLVANTGSNFVLSDGAGHSGSAVFIFATEAGTIRGWSPAVPPPPSHEAQLAVDRSGEGAIYKGLAIASTQAGDRLYATDFHNARVDVFDGSFGLVEDPGAFVDPTIPDGFTPFGIQSIGNAIFVTYAKQDEEAEDDVTGQGLGFVDMFDTNGALLGRVATRGRLDARWGLAMAPATFGRFTETCSSATSATARSTPTSRSPKARSRMSAGSGAQATSRSRSTASGQYSLATARRTTGRSTLSSSQPVRTTRSKASSGRSAPGSDFAPRGPAPRAGGADPHRYSPLAVSGEA